MCCLNIADWERTNLGKYFGFKAPMHLLSVTGRPVCCLALHPLSCNRLEGSCILSLLDQLGRFSMLGWVDPFRDQCSGFGSTLPGFAER